jgi:hypothetical protein
MRVVRIICLFIAASIVLAHSVFPHHHHVEPEQAIHNEDNDLHHDSDHHHDTDHHNDNADDRQHNLFTFGQIENTFLTGKQVMVPIAIAPVIEVFEWSFVAYTNQEPNNFYIKDIELPPWIRCHEISFRGPPAL